MSVLENETIRLRALEPEDLDVLYRWENDASLWHLGSTLAPYSRFSLKEYLKDSCLDLFHARQLRLMIVLRSTGESVGTIDLYDFDPMHGRAGVGVLIDNRFRRLGLARQALGLLKEYAFHFLFLKQLYAYIGANNDASLALFKQIGYEEAGLLRSWTKRDGGWEDVYLLQIINQEDQ